MFPSPLWFPVFFLLKIHGELFVWNKKSQTQSLTKKE